MYNDCTPVNSLCLIYGLCVKGRELVVCVRCSYLEREKSVQCLYTCKLTLFDIWAVCQG